MHSHPVFWKTRIIKNNQQLFQEEHSYIQLHSKKIVTPSETFQLDQVHDASFKNLNGTYGFLYLHTIKGVKAYMVKESPNDWIQAFHEMKRKL